MPEPLVRKVDCLQIPVPDLEAGLAFYRDGLGHELIWRTETAAGLRLPESDAELVIQTERPALEVNLLVSSADDACTAVVAAGGRVLQPPFDIAIGRCAVVADPWGNPLALPDMSKGSLVTAPDGTVLRNADSTIRVQPLQASGMSCAHSRDAAQLARAGYSLSSMTIAVATTCGT